MPKTKKNKNKMTTKKQSKDNCEICRWRESEIGYPSPCPKHDEREFTQLKNKEK